MEKSKIEMIKKEIESEKARSAWSKGVKVYCFELLENVENTSIEVVDIETFKAAALNGAESWRAYSWGSCSFICDQDIAENLCTASELKRNKNGERRPNQSEEWLDVQAMALNQAFYLLKKCAKAAGVF